MKSFLLIELLSALRIVKEKYFDIFNVEQVLKEINKNIQQGNQSMIANICRKQEHD